MSGAGICGQAMLGKHMKAKCPEVVGLRVISASPGAA